MSLNQVALELWLAALEGGQHRQATGILNDGVGMCCLGVAAEVHRQAVGGYSWRRVHLDTETDAGDQKGFAYLPDSLDLSGNELKDEEGVYYFFDDDQLELSDGSKVSNVFYMLPPVVSEWLGVGSGAGCENPYIGAGPRRMQCTTANDNEGLSFKEIAALIRAGAPSIVKSPPLVDEAS
jgi:hypothetical protein